MKLAEASVRWFGGESPPTDGEDHVAETIEIGRERYFGDSDRWLNQTDSASYGPARCLWALEAILGTTSASHAGSTDVRGESCTRYAAEVLPGEAAGQAETKLVDPPKSDDDWRALAADVCIDGRGYVRRIAWSPTTGRRFKPGLLRPAIALDRTPDSDRLTSGEGRLWNVIDLWDYGCHVDIAAPTELFDTATEGPSFREIVHDLWRMRREHKRRTARPEQSPDRFPSGEGRAPTRPDQPE